MGCFGVCRVKLRMDLFTVNGGVHQLSNLGNQMVWPVDVEDIRRLTQQIQNYGYHFVR